MAKNRSIIPLEQIERCILIIRGQKVMLDADLAELYGVETRILIRNVKRNVGRFPQHFMFQLTTKEFEALKLYFESKNLTSQYGISSSSWGGRRYPPYAFTEQGVAMLSSVLHSKRAIQVNIQIMDTFVCLRQILASHADLARKLEALEKKYDEQFKIVFDAIRELMTPPEPKKRPIGFLADR
jgi:hypothetical protein